MIMPRRMMMGMPVRRFIPVAVMASGPGAWLALRFRGRFGHLFWRELVFQRFGNLQKCPGGDAFLVKVDHRHTGIGRLGKERINGNGPQEGNLHHPGQLFTLIFSEKMDGIAATAGI